MSKKDLANPLQNLLDQAAKEIKPSEDTKRHINRFTDHSGAIVVLCDLSGSMALQANRLDPSGPRRIDALFQALRDVSKTHPNIITLGFNDHVMQFDANNPIGTPYGGTDLALALQYLGKYDPGVTIVISDGEPNSETNALYWASQITGRIDTIFVGDESNVAAINFMQRLSKTYGGQFVFVDQLSQRRLAATVQNLLALPASSSRDKR